MKTFWLFRSNLRQYEYYHNIDGLEQFKKECHDFYLLMGIWMLENTELEKFVVWRLSPKTTNGGKFSGGRSFNVNGKKFLQLNTVDFKECFNFNSPDITLFRGGFPEYAKITNEHPGVFGLKLYLGAGQRVYPKYGGIYDKILIEDERDFHPNLNCIPFYKTANPNIFYPMDLEKKWDICWPCNFAQLKYKGQEWFIEQVSKSDYLKSLKIVHLGNKPEEGIKLCQKHEVYNIDFKGWVTRPELNKYLNKSKVGLVTSNQLDGSPRVVTEILSSATPLIKRLDTRVTDNLLCKSIKDDDVSAIIKDWLCRHKGIRHTYNDWTKETHLPMNKGWSMDYVCQKNLELWNERE